MLPFALHLSDQTQPYVQKSTGLMHAWAHFQTRLWSGGCNHSGEKRVGALKQPGWKELKVGNHEDIRVAQAACTQLSRLELYFSGTG